MPFPICFVDQNGILSTAMPWENFRNSASTFWFSAAMTNEAAFPLTGFATIWTADPHTPLGSGYA